MEIHILDDSVKVRVYYEPNDASFVDNICICFTEACREEEKIFRASETHIYLTPQQATRLAAALNDAVEKQHESKS